MKSIRFLQLYGIAISGILATGFYTMAQATEAPINLGSCANFGVLAGTMVGSTGAAGTIIHGDVGVWPGTAVTGFPPATTTGAIHSGDGVAMTAQGDFTVAYNDAVSRSIAPHVVAGNIGGTTLHAGLHKSTSTLAISSGNLTLDGDGNPDSVFIIQVASAFTMTDGLNVLLINGASASNVFWQVGSSATFGTGSHFEGTILAHTAITFNSGSSLNGRALAGGAEVTLASNTVTPPVVPNILTFTFNGDQEQWTFLSPPVFDVSTGVRDAATTSLDVQTVSNNTFAFWESPTVQIAGSTLATTPGLFRTTYNISSNQAAGAAVPAIRLRSSSLDFQQTDALVISSSNQNSTLSPTTTARDYVQYFTQAVGNDQVRLDFDVLNFDSTDAASVLFSLNNVTVEALDTPTAGTPVVSYDFLTGANGFTARNASPTIVAPASMAASGSGLGITGTAQVAGKSGTLGADRPITIFGYWGLEATTSMLTANALYRVDFTVGTDAAANQAAVIPTFRMRVNSSSNAVAAMVNIDSRDTASREPAAGAPQTYSLYLQAPPQVAGDSFIFSFDYIYTNSQNDDPTVSLFLQDLTVTALTAPPAHV